MEQTVVPSVFDELEKGHPYFEHATTGQRLANYLIDIAIYYAFNYAFVYAVVRVIFSMVGSGVWLSIFGSRFGSFAVAYFNHVLLYTILEGATKGRTLGKFITGTQAVTQEITTITWRDAFVRSLCRIIPFEPFSGLGGSPWHDRISKTFVIKKTQRI